MNRRLLKIIVSILALSLLFRKVEIGPLLGAMQDTGWSYLYLSLVIYLLAQGICALKWKILAAPLEIILPLKEFIFYYFIGMFFNLFLPTSIGGDMSKCYYLVKRESNLRRAVFSVLGERLTGAISLLMVLIAGTLFSQNGHPIARMAGLGRSMIYSISFLTSVIPLGLVLSLTLVMFWPPLSRMARPYLLNRSWINRVGKGLPPRELLPFWENPAILLKAIGLGLLFQVLILLIHVSIGYSLGMTIPISYYFILYPIADIASFLPITLNGIGVREWSYTYLLTLVGVSPERAFGFSLLWFSILFLSSLLGGLVFLLGNFESPSRLSAIGGGEA